MMMINWKQNNKEKIRYNSTFKHIHNDTHRINDGKQRQINWENLEIFNEQEK